MQSGRTAKGGVELAVLLKRPEDETFDRTIGGHDSLGKEIAGLATRNGGVILVGQYDLKEGGAVKGVDENEFLGEYHNAISNVKPAPLTSTKIIGYGGRKLAVVIVQEAGNLKPCSYKGVYYERKGNATHQLSPEEIRRYHLAYGSNAEDMPTDASTRDIEPAELELYSKTLKKEEKNILKTVSTDSGHLTIRGVVVLAKEPEKHLEGAFIEIQKYKGALGAPSTPIGPPIKISKPAQALIEETAALIEQNLPLERTYEGPRMTQQPAIPGFVIREVVVNAVAHRNYRSHEHTRVRIHADGFDVSNPAVITQKTWEEMREMHATYHPNGGIYAFLNPVHLFEGRGEGIWKITQELEKRGKTAPEFKVIGDAPSSFYARISVAPAKAFEVRLQQIAELAEKRGGLTSTDVMKKLKVSRVTAIALLKKMERQQLLEHTGSMRSSRYMRKTAVAPK